MGYTIIIGEASDINDVDELPVGVTEDVYAPIFGGDTATHNTNVRKPMYSEWDDFLSNVGLYELFFNPKSGLMREHPGIETLDWQHYQAVNEAYLIISALGINTVHNADFVRLSWLRFWMKWALTNCSKPVIYNF